jgi:hypothetical protein
MSQDNGFLDIGPANVSGAITARRARVMWKDGTLYVFKTPTSWVLRETSEPVLLSGNGATSTYQADDVEFTRRGCATCGWQLGRHSALDLLAKT